LLMGKAADAVAAAGREQDEPTRLYMLACSHWKLGQRAESDAAAGKLEAGFSATSPYLIAIAHSCRGEADTAIKWLEQAYRQRDGLMPEVRINPLLRNLHGHPGFQALLVKMNLAG